MGVYIALFLLCVFFYLSTIHQRGNQDRKLFLVMSALCLFVGVSDMLGGYDRYIYCEIFDQVADKIDQGVSPYNSSLFKLYVSEPGYCYYNVLLAHVTSNRYVFILITTILMYGLFYCALKRYSINPAFAVVVFLALMFFFSFTYLRQMLSVGISWLAIQYAIKRKPIIFFALVTLATSFHNSAIIMAPLYFIPIHKPKISVVLLIMILSFGIGLTSVPSDLFNKYGDISDMTERGAAFAAQTEGFRIAYLLESCFFLFIILCNYDSIARDKTSVLMLNMALIFCSILLIFVQSENGGRLAWFYLIGVISTITQICCIKRQLSRYGIIMLVLSFFLFMRIVNAWGILLSPYKTFFSTGVREGDYIERIYEYDHKYDSDKFYR